jgi:hypothetical protein
MPRTSARVTLSLLALLGAACSENAGVGGHKDAGSGNGHGDGAAPGGSDGAANPNGMDASGPTPGSDASGAGTDGSPSTADDASGNGLFDAGFPPGTMFESDGAIILPDGALFVAPDAGMTGCGPTEICGNGLDDNCNGEVDEGCACTPGSTQACYGGLPANAGLGVCTMGTQTCLHGDLGAWGPCMGDGRPQPVMCGGHQDYRCDGIIDEGCFCAPGTSETCYDGPPNTAGVGLCRAGTRACTMTATGSAWGPCTGEVTPAPMNPCDGMDHECTGMPYAGCACTPGDTRSCYDGPAGTAGVGLCHNGMQSCASGPNGPAWGPCVGEAVPSPNNPCDGLDHLCNGMPFAGCACTPGATTRCYDGPMGTVGVGVCTAGMQVCTVVNGQPTLSPCSGEVTPSPDTCDGVDRECNGMPLGGACGCVLGTSRPCYDGPMGTAGVGACHGGMQQCVAGMGGGSTWSACQGEVTPAPDNCDGVDRECNGMALAGCTCQVGTTRPCYDGPANTRGVGICHDGTQACVAGAAGGSMWGTSCDNEVTPAPAEICGNGLDDNCNGAVDEGCGPQVTCPADVTTLAGTAVNLSASASSAGRTITGYSWSITAAPAGGIGTPNQWAPTPPNSATETFLPYIVGAYTLQVTATDSGGASASCSTHVTAEGHGLRVELTWDGSGDVDLHLHDPNTGTPWYNGDDCYYADLSPIWDGTHAAATGGNPSLDFDNTTGFGPENTRIDAPALNVAYTIGVHNYYNAGGRTATVQVFCGGVASPTQTFTSSPLTGTGGSNCSDGTFWKVASVVFTSPTTCTITPIQDYSTGSTRCSAF